MSPEVLFADPLLHERQITVEPDDPLFAATAPHRDNPFRGAVPEPERLYEFWKPAEPQISPEFLPTEVTVPRPPGPYVDPEKWYPFWTNGKGNTKPKQ